MSLFEGPGVSQCHLFHWGSMWTVRLFFYDDQGFCSCSFVVSVLIENKMKTGYYLARATFRKQNWTQGKKSLALLSILLNPALKSILKKEMSISLHRESVLLLTDMGLYSLLLHCSAAQLDSENQWCTRGHRGERGLGVPSKRATKALVPLAEGRGAACAPGRHRWSPSLGMVVAVYDVRVNFSFGWNFRVSADLLWHSYSSCQAVSLCRWPGAWHAVARDTKSCPRAGDVQEVWTHTPSHCPVCPASCWRSIAQSRNPPVQTTNQNKPPKHWFHGSWHVFPFTYCERIWHLRFYQTLTKTAQILNFHPTAK